MVRLLSPLPGYGYAHRAGDLYVNLYVAGTAIVPTAAGDVTLAQETDYPWLGAVKLTVDPPEAAAFTLRLRIPGWARGEPVPSDLYRHLDAAGEAPSLRVNGAPADLQLGRGFAVVRRHWCPRDGGGTAPADAGRALDPCPRALRREQRCDGNEIRAVYQIEGTTTDDGPMAALATKIIDPPHPDCGIL